VNDLQQAWRGLAPNTRGVIWALLAAVFMSVMSVLIKYMSGQLSSFEVAWFRASFGLMVVLPFVWRYGGLRAIRTRRLPMHLLRGVFAAFAMTSGFYAVSVLPLALATSLSFARPLFMVPLAIIFLHEIVRARRWTATIVGFVGVVVAVHPTGDVDPAVLASLFSALMVACSLVVTKRMTDTEGPTTLMFYAGVFGTVFTLIPALLVWQTPTVTQFGFLLAIGVVGSISNNFMIRSLTAGEATIVGPIEYLRIISSAAFGFLIFAEVPTWWMIGGSLIIVASTLYIAIREARLGAARRRKT
jgi:drug/metabolite transporter (DMT)-like permease